MRKEYIITIQRFTQLLLYILFFVHISGWIWINIGKRNDNGWISAKSYLLENDEVTIYVAAIYYIVTTLATVGYGDFIGAENDEMIFSIVLELWGIGFFGYITGNINSTIINAESISALKEAKEEQVNMWLMSLQRSYRERILNPEYYIYTSLFYNSLWDKDYGEVWKSEFFKKLKPQLQNELCDHIFK